MNIINIFIKNMDSLYDFINNSNTENINKDNIKDIKGSKGSTSDIDKKNIIYNLAWYA